MSKDNKSKIKELNEQIDTFVNQFKHFPKQKSPEWVKMRTDGMDGVYLGGSDIASAINVNDYQSPGQLIRAKCGLKTARDSSDPIAMHWGSLFEDVIARHIEMEFKTTIKGTEMIICGHSLFRYSPDGFIVAGVKLVDGELIICSLDDPNGTPVIILCEFKSLWARLSKDYIPKYYIPQPLAGLEVAPIAYMSLYVEGLFKVCSMEDLGSNKNYSRKIHTRQRFLDKYPVAWGMFSVYCVDEKEHDDFYQKFRNNDDIGSFSSDNFKYVMKKIDSGVYTTEFTDPKPYSPEAIEILYDRAQNCYDHRYFIGVIPWKLFEMSYFNLERDPEFVPEIAETLEKTNKLIKQVKLMPECERENFVTKEFVRLGICDEERGIQEVISDRTAAERNFLDSL
jgi:hypothetical protein